MFKDQLKARMGPGLKKGSNWTHSLPRLDPRMWPLRGGDADLLHPSVTFVKQIHLNLHYLVQPDTPTQKTQDKTRPVYRKRRLENMLVCVCVWWGLHLWGGAHWMKAAAAALGSTLYIHVQKSAERTTGTLTLGTYLQVEMREQPGQS